MENKVGIRELKQNASAVVALAKGGESVTITEHGKPVAMLIPYPQDIITRLELEGKLVKGTDSFDFAEIRRTKLDGTTIADLLDESRADRL
jgi:prevent-host-death family protein